MKIVIKIVKMIRKEAKKMFTAHSAKSEMQKLSNWSKDSISKGRQRDAIYSKLLSIS